MGAIEIRELRDGDEESLLETYEAAFADPSARGAPRRTLEEWTWAYRRNPAGTRVFVATSGEGVVAQYAALPARTWIDGRAYTFSQVVDSMVHPDHRAGLKRPGLFVEVGRAFFDAFGGRDRDVVFYGWPVEANRRIGERFLGYERAQSLVVLTRDLGVGGDAPEGVAALDRFDEQAVWLYERCVGAWGASTVRDEPYLNWRYVERPRTDYWRLGVRDGAGTLSGLCVARLGRWSGVDVALVADWLVPEEERTAARRLLRALEARGRDAGASAAVVAMPAWSPWFEFLQGEGYRVRPAPYDLVVRPFDRRFDSLFLRERWWHQLGDSDLV